MEYFQSGIAATGASLAGAGFTYVKADASPSVAGEAANSMIFRAASELSEWNQSGPLSDEIGEIARITGLGPARPNVMNIDVISVYKRPHSELNANLDSLDVLSVKTPVVDAGQTYPDSALAKGMFYLVGNEIVGVHNNTVSSGLGYKNATVIRGCFMTTETTHSTDDRIYQVCFGFPDIEFWGAAQAVKQAADESSASVGYFQIDDKMPYQGEQFDTFITTYAGTSSFQLLAGDSFTGRITAFGLHPDNDSPAMGAGVLLYTK